MLLSVVMPVYNAEQYLSDMLNSILNQTFTDFELICVDDCSTDSTPDILDDFKAKDSRINIVHKDKNARIFAAIKTGVEICTGDYIHIVDADDILHPQMFEIMTKTAIDTNADVVWCNHTAIDSNQTIKFNEIYYNNLQIKQISFKEFMDEYYNLSNMSAALSAMYYLEQINQS